MFKQIGPLEVVLIFILVMVLFGAKRLPDAARGLGRSLRIFKAETKGLDDAADTPAAIADPAPAAAVGPAVATPGVVTPAADPAAPRSQA